MPDLPKNKFKEALLAGKRQIGLWVTSRDAVATEMLAQTGFDAITIDCEHTTHDIHSVVQALQAMKGSDVSPVVRPPSNDPIFLKRLLDAGVQSFVIPYVQNADEARLAAEAVAYAPNGFRGVAGATRATMFGAIPNYFTRARDEICLIVQVESQEALDNIEEIAAVEGVDGIFIGPADLAADMGFGGNSAAQEVQAVILGALEKIRAAGKAPGILSLNDDFTRQYLHVGAQFVAVGIDVVMLAQTARDTAQKWKS